MSNSTKKGVPIQFKLLLAISKTKSLIRTEFGNKKTFLQVSNFFSIQVEAKKNFWAFLSTNRTKIRPKKGAGKRLSQKFEGGGNVLKLWLRNLEAVKFMLGFANLAHI
jgi:hypothetical protein